MSKDQQEEQLNYFYANKKEPNLNWYQQAIKKSMNDFQMFKNLASLLSSQARLKLFQEYCAILKTNIPEKMWLETTRSLKEYGAKGITKTHVYRYLPKTESRQGGKIPNAETTAKIAVALLKEHKQIILVKKAMDQARDEIHLTYERYDSRF